MPPSIALGSRFATLLPELAVPWQAMRPEHPTLLALNAPLARELGIDPDLLRSAAGVRLLLGNLAEAGESVAPGARPVAQVYAGHQFGGYAPRLGDGRALLLGELTDPDGVVHDLHLKGSGRTPFARADGFAAVGPMLREHLVGEAMHALGIPTTRALAVVGTGRLVPRDEGLLPGAVLARVASSHLRVGTFQYARSTGDADLLRRLADHAIARHYPALAAADDPYPELLRAVVEAQASLVAAWMLVGFVHGVMNTDNTTVSGETIDYGPCAFLDAYDPATVFSSIDHGGRYAYGNQPQVALWNLTRFAEALLPLLGDSPDRAVDTAQDVLAGFATAYDAAWLTGMRAKLGLADRADVDDRAVTDIAGGLLHDLHSHRLDYTGFFRGLSQAARGRPETISDRFERPQPVGDWFDAWLALRPDGEAMDRANPVYIPRNRLVDEALARATEGDPTLFESLLAAVERPFEERPGLERYALAPPPGSAPHRTYCGT